MTIHYSKAHFLLSVANLTQLPPDNGIEIAFVGRSNAGKSSVLNRLTQQKHLARVSTTPGRTQLINYFVIDETRRLVDLPGYGYAKVPPKIKQDWTKLLDQYFQTRQSLKGLIVVMDIRHPLREGDQQILNWCHQCNLPVHILLNKADKLSNGEIKQTLQTVKNALGAYANPISCQSFSAAKGKGVEELHKTLDAWYTAN